MKKIALALVCVLGMGTGPNAHDTAAPPEFFPMKVGTYWVYEGAVRYQDPEKEEATTEKVSWRMTVDKVIHREGLIATVVTGFPADLDWSAGTAQPKQWLILEDSKRKVHYVDLGPGFDLAKYEKGNATFDKFLVDDALLFEWPLKKGAKFCDEDSKKRDDNMYCWYVADEGKRKLDNVSGVPVEERAVFELRYVSNPDDTSMELVQGIGLISYRYHHHGTVADTELQLVEFHPASEGASNGGTKP
ncbi:MAG TPA: hypothetical protein VMT75_09430 [Candidatus Saccharimonadales bacterium]|nr:hypothetical protein [Candidatus Saccharimonadales bacterium]